MQGSKTLSKMPDLQAGPFYSVHRFTLQLGYFSMRRRFLTGEYCKVTCGGKICRKWFHSILQYEVEQEPNFQFGGGLVSPKEEPVEWSCPGTKRPSLSPESQSHSSPDSGGGLLTHPQKSISKSQKPGRRSTDAQ